MIYESYMCSDIHSDIMFKIHYFKICEPETPKLEKRSLFELN